MKMLVLMANCAHYVEYVVVETIIHHSNSALIKKSLHKNSLKLIVNGCQDYLSLELGVGIVSCPDPTLCEGKGVW